MKRQRSLILIFLFTVPFLSCTNISQNGHSEHIILITLDTTRADHLACYGYNKIETPNLDLLASNGILFLNTTCQAPITLPSHISILTGMYPPEFDVRHNLGYVLHEDVLTLAEILKKDGYSTGAVVSSVAVSKNFGIAQGFDSYDEPQAEAPHFIPNAKTANVTISSAIEWLVKNKEGKFFLWIHLFDPHADYEPPPPFSSIYKDAPYDGEIAFMDGEIGRLWEFLKKDGLWDDSLIVVVGDHGEGLGDHNELRHLNLIYESTMHVPFLMKGKGLPKNISVSEISATIDILPTILEYLSIPVPPHVRGESLLGCIGNRVKRIERDIYIESLSPRILFGWSELRGLRSGRWKYIKAPVPELYDLEEDPQEMNNVFEEETVVASDLSRKLYEMEQDLEARGKHYSRTVAIDEQSRKALLSLGYVSATMSKDTPGNIKNPKNYIFLESDLEKCLKAIEKKDFEEVITICRSIAQIDPDNKTANLMNAQALISTGRFQPAVDQLKRLLNTYKDDYFSFGLLSKLYIDTKMYKEAEKVFLDALQYYPDSFDFNYGLAVCYYGRGRFRDAIPSLEKAISINHSNPLSYVILSKCYHALGLNKEAEESMKKARILGFQR